MKLRANSRLLCYPHRQTGFSILELLVVIAIIFVMVASAVPTYNQTIHAYQIRNDSDNLMGLLMLARLRAASEFARARVTCDSTTGTCSLSTKQISVANWPSTPNEIQKVILSRGVAFAIPTGATSGAGGQSTTSPAQGTTGQANPYFIEFNSRGLPIDDSGNPVGTYAIYITDQQYGTSAAVAVDYSGKAQVYNLQIHAYSLRQE